MSEHAKLSPSSAHRWLFCPASVEAESKYPNVDNVYSAEGTLAHEWAYYKLSDKAQSPPSSEPLSDEMALHLDTYVDYCNVLKKDSAIFLLEQKVTMEHITPECFGTVDCLSVKDGVLTIVDLKYGQGVRVDATDNYQLVLYALGAYNLCVDFIEIHTINMVIVQPRLDHISENEISADELLKYVDFVKEKARRATKKNARYVPGESQCRFCKAKPTCKALKSLTDKTIKRLFDKTPAQLSHTQLKEILDQSDLITTWLSSVKEHVTDYLLAGNVFNGYKLVNGRGMRKWRDDETVIPLLEGCNFEDGIYTKKLLSVAQAEKKLKLLKQKFSDELKGEIVVQHAAVKLAKSDDKRESVTTIATADDF